MGTSQKVFARLGYVFFSLFWVMISLVILFWGANILDPFKSFIHCPVESGEQFQCLGITAVYRMSFVLALFHTTVFLVCLSKSDSAAAFHDGCWALKFLVVLAGFVLTLFIPNSFFTGYSDFARVISVFFLVYQVFMTITIAYLINDKLVGHLDNQSGESNNRAVLGSILIGTTVILYSANIIIWVFLYIEFKDCGSAIANITVALVASVVFTVLVVFRPREDASILTSGAVALYVNYLCWSALSSNPDANCNPAGYSKGNTIAQILVGLFFVLVALFSVSSMTKNEETQEQTITDQVNNPLLETEKEDENIPERDIKEEPLKAQQINKISGATILFQVLMILASFYYAMLLTNWGSPTTAADLSTLYLNSGVSYWVKLVADWLSILVYILSLLAPLIFKNREF